MVEIHKYSVKQCHYKKYSHFKGRDTAKIPGRHTHAILSRDRMEDDENIFVQRCQSIYVYNLCSHTGLHTNTHTHTHTHTGMHTNRHTLSLSLSLSHISMKALKCKTLGGILRCRLTNALSRQLALLAEPKNPLDSTMSTSSGFFVHTMKHCYATALYTTEAQALSITHARIYKFTARVQSRA